MASSISGHTAAWAARYSSKSAGLTRRWKQMRCTVDSLRWGRGAPTATSLEVEVVDVVGVEYVGVAEEHGAVGADGVGAEFARLERIPFGPGDLPVDQGRGRVGGEVPEVLGVPQREGGHGAVLDVLAHLVGGAQAGQRDLVLELGGRQVAGRRGDAHGRG